MARQGIILCRVVCEETGNSPRLGVNVATCCHMSCCLDTLADMQCRQVANMTEDEDVSAICRDTTQHVCK